MQTENKRKKFIPGFNTLKILEKRKNYILDKMESKLESKTEKESYFKSLIDEIRALDKTMDFIKWIQNNFANDMVREIINKYEAESEQRINEENETEETGNKKDAVVYGIIDEKQGKDRKFEIIFSRDEGVNYISIASQRRKKTNISWEKTNEIKMTVNKLEKILRKEKEIENYQIENNGI